MTIASWMDGDSLAWVSPDGAVIGWSNCWSIPGPYRDPARMCEDEHGSAEDVWFAQRIWQKCGWWDACWWSGPIPFYELADR